MKDKLKYCFLLYYVFGVFGSVVELLWYYYINNYLHNPDQFPAFFTLTPVRACYGFGAVFIYIIVPNILKRYQGRFRIVLNYFLNLIIGVVIEIIAAFVLVLKFGYNPLWNYSKQPFNFMGYICLENSVIFGFIGIFFIYIAFP